MAEQSGSSGNKRANLNDIARSVTGGSRTAGIIVAICMVVLGILFMVWPMRTDYVVMIIATIGFIIYGVYQIIVYARTPHDYKNGWTLANGIIYTILGFLILWEGPADMFMTFAFLLGFLAMFSGIMQCTNFGVMRSNGVSGAGWMLVSGILNIIVGIFLLVTPFAATWAIAYVLGIYLVVGGVALFAEAASGQHGIRQ